MTIEQAKVVAFWIVGAFMGVACSSSSSSPGGTSTQPTCDQICSHVGSVCGATPPTCGSACGQWSNDTRSCVSGAATCNALLACGSTSGDGGGSSSSGGSSGGSSGSSSSGGSSGSSSGSSSGGADGGGGCGKPGDPCTQDSDC